MSSISVAVISVEKSSEALDILAQQELSGERPGSVPYFMHASCVRRLIELLLVASQMGPGPAAPAILSWALLSRNLRDVAFQVRQEREIQSLDSSELESAGIFEEPCRMLSDVPEDFVTESNAEEDIVKWLAEEAIGSCQVFDTIEHMVTTLGSIYDNRTDMKLSSIIRVLFLGVVRESLIVVNYSSEVILATIAIITEKHCYWDIFSNSILSTLPALELFLGDYSILRRKLLDEALARYPNDMWPLTRLCRALLPAANNNNNELVTALNNASTLTQQMPLEFEEYEVGDEDSIQLIKLSVDLFLFIHPNSISGNYTTIENADDAVQSLFIPTGTRGEITNNTAPYKIRWEFHHSVFQYLAQLLSTASSGVDCVALGTSQPADIDQLGEIVGLFASTVSAISIVSTEIAGSFIEDTSEVLSGPDLISLILDILNSKLQTVRVRPNEPIPLELFSVCIQFLHSVMQVSPQRVWSFLNRANFLDLEDFGNSTILLVLDAESQIGHYESLIGVIDLLGALVLDIIKAEPTRKDTSRTLTRFGNVRSVAGSPNSSKSRIIDTFVKILAGVFESLASWKFAVPFQQTEINTSIMKAFHTLLQGVYGHGDALSDESGANAPLIPAAKYLISVFLSSSANNLPLQPLINSLNTLSKSHLASLFTRETQLWRDQTVTSLKLCDLLLRIGIYLNITNATLGASLFRAVPLLARLYAMQYESQQCVVQLLGTMARSVSLAGSEPTSLFGALDAEASKEFLLLLSDFGQPVHSQETQDEIWRFLGIAIQCRQQWISSFIMTGSSPKDLLVADKGRSVKLETKSILSVALAYIKGVKNLPYSTAIAILQFLSEAYNYFPLAIRRSSTLYSAAKDACVEYLSQLQWDDRPQHYEVKSQELAIAALVAEFLAMDIHQSRQMGIPIAIDDLYPHTNILRMHAVGQLAYNHSLHANLRKNVEASFNCSLQSFKHSPITKPLLGSDYVYDLVFVGNLLGSQSSKSGFMEEFAMANVNLSYVQSQVQLLKGWQLLAAEVIFVLKKGSEKYGAWCKALVKTAEDCLLANMQATTMHNVFEHVRNLRADLALVLIKSLLEKGYDDFDVQQLTSIVWEAIRECGQDFDSPFRGHEVEYYRKLLRILFISLRLEAQVASASYSTSGTGPGMPSKSVPLNNAKKPTLPNLPATINEILSDVVSRGFRSFALQLHDDPLSCSPSDLVLLTAILQSALSIPGILSAQQHVAAIFAANEISRYATTLFSWSDRLAIDKDPIYGELTILFLLELSIIPAIAEQMAIDGVLTQLSAASLTEYFRRPNGMGSSDRPYRLYSIWTRGILPLCLNLLHSVGPPIAGEVVSFLNQFPNQLLRCSMALDSRNRPARLKSNEEQITLGLASEAHSLALIATLLDHYRDQGPAVGILPSDIEEFSWNREEAKEDIETWLQGRRALRDRIVAINERDSELMRLPPLKNSNLCDNRLEEAIVSELTVALTLLSS
jgi:nuclear pore complex protein Nup188